MHLELIATSLWLTCCIASNELEYHGADSSKEAEEFDTVAVVYNVLEAKLKRLEQNLSLLKAPVSHELMAITAEQIHEANQRMEIAILQKLGAVQASVLAAISTPRAKVIQPESFEDCTSVWNHGLTASGQYVITADGLQVPVYCDQKTGGGGWLVIQRRSDGTANFYRNWTQYSTGFGDVGGEFYLGNRLIHKLSKDTRSKLRVDITDSSGKNVYALYDEFYIEDEEHGYQLHLGNYIGTAGDSLRQNSGKLFSTADRDNDGQMRVSCAKLHHGAFWYADCGASNPNGAYMAVSGQPMSWTHAKWSHTMVIKEIEMKIRPVL